jgi:hypothetical protein
MKKLMCLFAFGVSLAGATPINYTIAGIATGSLTPLDNPVGHTPPSSFTNAPFSFTFFSDTSLPTYNYGSGIVTTPALSSVTVAVGNLAGSILSTIPVRLVDATTVALNAQLYPASYGSLWFDTYNNLANAAILLESPVFASYDLESTIGPVSVTGQINPFQRGPYATIQSTLGYVSFDNWSNLTFAADSIAATPEPASFALLGLGMVAIGGWRKLARRS